MSWAIHNALKGWTLYDLSEREVQLLIQSMSSNEIRLSRVSKAGSENWQALNNQLFPQLFSGAVGDSKKFPLVDAASNASVDTDYFVIRPKKIMFPRLHKRYELSVPCTIFSTSKQFDSTTLDLSEGGIFFKETIPDWVAGYFIVSLQSPQGPIQLMCSLVEDQKDKKRVQIVSEESDPQFLLYKDWLNRSQSMN